MRVLCAAAAALCLTLPATAGHAPAEPDYYVLSLSWSPNWCLLHGRARDDAQCDGRDDHAIVLHGLWPTSESGAPIDCHADAAPLPWREAAKMADIMGSAAKAMAAWQDHGRCSGLSPKDYFATARAAFEKIVQPPMLITISHDIRLPASVVRDTFVDLNPGLRRSMITITCEGDVIDDARICLDRDLTPRACGPAPVAECRLKEALLTAAP